MPPTLCCKVTVVTIAICFEWQSHFIQVARWAVFINQNPEDTTKGGFFSESAMRFLSLQISKKNIPKNYPELEI